MLRILVVDDHDAVRKAICQLLRSQADFDVICEVADGFEAVRMAEELQPDVVVLDISMPNSNGIEAARHIRRVAPGAEIQDCSLDRSERGAPDFDSSRSMNPGALFSPLRSQSP